MSNNTN